MIISPFLPKNLLIFASNIFRLKSDSWILFNSSDLKGSRYSFVLLDLDRSFFSRSSNSLVLGARKMIFGYALTRRYFSHTLFVLCAFFVQLFFQCSILCSGQWFWIFFRYIAMYINWYIYFIPGRLLGRRRTLVFFFP